MPDNKIRLIIEAVNRAKDAFASLRQDFDGVQRKAEDFRLKTGEIRSALASLGGIAALYGISRALTSSLDAAEQMENKLRGLAAVARYAGEDLGQSMAAAAKLSEDGLLDVAAASQALQNLLARGFSLKESVDIITRLKDAAAFNRQSHLSMSEAVTSATEGLKNENSILVDNAGVTKNVSVMWKEYADSIGKSVAHLTQAEKRQAEYNGVMRETEAQVGNAKLATEGITGAKARLTVEVMKLKTALGQSLTPAFYEIAKAANWVMQNAIIPFLAGIEMLSTKVAAFFSKNKLLTELSQLERLKSRPGAPEQLPKTDARIAEIRRQLAQFEKDEETQLKEIYEKYTGSMKVPQIGPDRGKRRTADQLAGGAAGGEKKVAEKAAKEAQKLQAETLEEYWQTQRDHTQALVELEKQITESQATELEKRVTAAQEEADRQRAVLIQAYEDGAVDWQTYRRLNTEIAGAEADRRSEIAREEAAAIAEENMAAQKKQAAERKALREQEITSQLFELDLAEAAGTAHRDTLAARIRIEEELLRIREEALAAIDREKDPTGWIAQRNEIDEVRASLVKLRGENEAATGSFGAGWDRGIRDYLHNLQSAFDDGKKMADETARAMSQSFSDFFFDVFTGRLKTLEDYFMAFYQSIARAAADILSQQVVKSLLGLIPALGGGSLPLGSTFGVDSILTPVGHTGGVMGQDGLPWRIVPTSAFANAPRYHGGVGPGERAAIIRDDEGIFTPAQMKNLSPAGGVRNTFIINAMDSLSFQDFIRRNPGPIVDATTRSLESNRTRSRWKRSLK